MFDSSNPVRTGQYPSCRLGNVCVVGVEGEGDELGGQCLYLTLDGGGFDREYLSARIACPLQ